jgi:sugar phosphate permease
MDSYLQKRIPSGERATITSFCAVAPHIGGAIGLVVSGVIAQCFGITVAWVISGMSLIVGAIVISRNGNGKSEE